MKRLAATVVAVAWLAASACPADAAKRQKGRYLAPQLKPEACLSYGHGVPRLTERSSDVIRHPMTIQRANEQYNVETYSAKAFEVGRTDRWCGRYEMANVGSKEIGFFFWSLFDGAGFTGKDLKPRGVPRSYTLVNLLPPSLRMPSNIIFFEKTTAETEIWGRPAPRKTQYRAELETMEDGQALPRFADPLDFVQGLSSYAEERGISMHPALERYLRNKDDKVDVLVTTYSGSHFSMRVVAEATRTDTQIIFNTRISVKASEPHATEYAIPALQASPALESLPAILAIGDAQDGGQFNTQLTIYKSFLHTFRSMRNFVEPNTKGKWTFELSLPITSIPQGAIYRMYHPVVVTRGNEADCFMALSYSPIPLSFNQTQCPAFGDIIHGLSPQSRRLYRRIIDITSTPSKRAVSALPR